MIYGYTFPYFSYTAAVVLLVNIIWEQVLIGAVTHFSPAPAKTLTQSSLSMMIMESFKYLQCLLSLSTLKDQTPVSQISKFSMITP